MHIPGRTGQRFGQGPTPGEGLWEELGPLLGVGAQFLDGDHSVTGVHASIHAEMRLSAGGASWNRTSDLSIISAHVFVGNQAADQGRWPSWALR